MIKKESKFWKYCIKCAYVRKSEKDTPCVDCLSKPLKSRKPVHFWRVISDR